MTKPLSVSEQLAHSTVRIEVEYPNGQIGTGTGFFYRFAVDGDVHVPAIVTNKHVIEGSKTGRFKVTVADSESNPNYGNPESYSFDKFSTLWTYHPDPEVDLCAMPIAPLLQAAEASNKKLFFVPFDKTLIPSEQELSDMTAMEDIVMIGYPNGIWDEKHNMPVLRKGVTATHLNLDWNGKPEFLIDAACFPGSSGSPVFLFNLGGYATRSGGMIIGTSRVKFVGVLYAGPQHTVTGEIKIVNVPIIDKPVSITTIPNNLGIVIKAIKLDELDLIFTQMVAEERPLKPNL